MINELEYKVEYEVDKETGQVIATLPDLNNISSFGDSFLDAEAHVQEAAIGYLELLLKEKKEIPRPIFQDQGTYLRIAIPIIA